MIRAVIIDDEESARNVLSSILKEYCVNVEVVGTAKDVPSGVIQINKHNPDIVFLDVEMPNYSGFELLDFFQEIKFEIIFATAYSEYAIKAFDVSAVDYLLKPLQIDKVELAVQKAIKKIEEKKQVLRFQALKVNLKSEMMRKVALPVTDGLEFVNVDDIICIQADGSYSDVYLLDESKITISRRIKFFEGILLENPNFYRPHRSYIVHLPYVKKYNKSESSVTMQNDTTVFISRDKKTEFETLFEGIKLV